METRKNVARMALSPDALYLLVVDVEGKAIFFNMREMVVLHHVTFKGGSAIGDIKFSPDSRQV